MKMLTLLLLLATSTLFWGCLEGEEGTAGAPGVGCATVQNADSLTISIICGADTITMAKGKNGTDGAQGPAGTDGVNVGTGGSCVTCHNSGTDLISRQQQYAMSTHATGGHAVYGNRTSCAGCHTHEGFKEVVAAGGATVNGVANAFATPTQPNCRTCHNIHTAYDSTDWGNTVPKTDSVLINISATKYAFGSGNVCATCHQPRGSLPLIADTAVVLSTHYGPHHGPQSATLVGTAGYSFTGQAAPLPTASTHKTIANTCVACHMANEADNNAVESGGHQFGMRDGSAVPKLNVVGCTVCHNATTLPTLPDANKAVDTLQLAITTSLKTLGDLMVTKGLLSIDTALEFHVVADTVSGDIAGAVWNFNLISEDQSKGVHNPAYVKALIANTSAFVTTLP